MFNCWERRCFTHIFCHKSNILGCTHCFWLFTLWFIDEGASFLHFFLKLKNIRSWRCFSSSKIRTQFSHTFCNIHNWPLHSFSQDYGLASRITYVVCVNFICEWRDLQFNGDRLFEKLFHGRFIYSKIFYRKSAERKSPKKYFSYFIFDDWPGILTQAFASKKPTHHILEHGDLQHYHDFQSNVAIFPSVVQEFTQPYSFGGRIKRIICHIRHELSVTIH